MMQATSPTRNPGDGAERPTERGLSAQYVYAALSRRAGGLSLGVDLTPQGHCTFACVYCQASHPVLKYPNLTVDTNLLREELNAWMRGPRRTELKDLVVAGAGEPTAISNLSDALGVIVQACAEHEFGHPRKIFTNGRHLGSSEVAGALADFAKSGGEIWVKLDGASTESLEQVNGRVLDVERHLQGIWDFAKTCPIGVQTMVFHGATTPSPRRIVDEVRDALVEGIRQGALIARVHVLTLRRTPADPTQASQLSPVDPPELDVFACEIAKATGIPAEAYA